MQQIKIGWAKREISFNEPVSIPGQMHIRVSEGIHDPLYITALCLDDGLQQVIFLSCDIVSLGCGIIEMVKEAVASACPDIPKNNIILNVTHTHAGIDLRDMPPTTPDGVAIYSGEKVRRFFCDMAVEAICQAWDTRAEGGIAYGYGYAVVGHSRRAVYFKEQKLAQQTERQFMTPAGYAVMYGKTNDPLFSHYEAGADHFLNLLYTFDARQKLTGVVINVPCPSQLSGQFTKLSADYWNEVRQDMAQAFGPEVYVLPQCAAAGDISPLQLHYTRAEQRRLSLKYGISYDCDKIARNNNHYYNRSIGQRRDAAERIVAGVREVYDWAKKDIRTQVPVRHHRLEMELERRRITEEERQWCAENLALLEQRKPRAEDMTGQAFRVAMSRHNSAVNRNQRGIDRYEDVQKEPTITMPAHVVQVGDVAFATTRCELFMDFMHRLQARSPFIQTFVVQLAGAENGSYLATHRAVDAKGYSASMFCNVFSADAGQYWVEEILKVINQMKQEQ